MVWSISDVRENKEYRLELCQSSEGKRIFRLIESDVEKSPDALFRTTKVDNSLLLKRNLIAISKAATLENGDKFFVDPHGMWLTERESDQLENGVDIFDVVWETNVPPQLARK